MRINDDLNFMLFEKDFVERKVRSMQIELRKLGIDAEAYANLMKEGVQYNQDMIRVPLHRQKYPPLRVEIVFIKPLNKSYRLRWLEMNRTIGNLNMVERIDPLKLEMQMKLVDWDARYTNRQEKALTASITFELKRLHEYPATKKIAEKFWQDHTNRKYPTKDLRYPDPEVALKNKEPAILWEACAYYLVQDYERPKLFLEATEGKTVDKSTGQSKAM